MKFKRTAEICPICFEPYFKTKQDHNTCSDECRRTLLSMRKSDMDKLKKNIERTQKMKTPPMRSCAAYDSTNNDCYGLNALWCTVGECKFYKNKNG